MKVCVGGTFDPLHNGHKRLLDKTFELGEEVLIGLTSDEMARSWRGVGVKVSPYGTRAAGLEEYFKMKGYEGRYKIVPLRDRHGPAVELAELEGIVVSPETVVTAWEINKIREKRGLAPLKIHMIKFVLADDDTPIKATRIKKGDMDASGRMLRPLAVVVGSTNRVKVKAVENVFTRVFRLRSQERGRDIEINVNGIEVDSGVSSQPMGDEAIEGAINRAKASISSSEGADFGVGIEAGLFLKPELGYFDVQYCAIVDKMGRVTIGHGSGFQYPERVIYEVTRERGAEDVGGKTEVGKVMENLYGIKDIGSKEGAIGYLSKGALNRTQLTEQAVLMALVPRLRRELYL